MDQALEPARVSRARIRHRLPPQPRSLVGRADELAQARDLLLDPRTRLLTLIGPPGVGKTRLAVALATSVLDAFEDGVVFVDLSTIAVPELVPEAIARAVGIHEFGNRAPLAVLEEFLGSTETLLVLDNLEQIIEAGGYANELLTACANLKLLATSRSPLHIRWERELPVRPLRLPEAVPASAAEAVARSAAIQLFVERAQALVPGYALSDAEAGVVTAICAQLDGLPLAIELAAARSKLFSPNALLQRLGGQSDRMELRLLSRLDRDVPVRQQTLAEALRWSYDLLVDSERVLFRRLAVFVGGCTLSAAESVCSTDDRDDLLEAATSLLDQSLLWRDDTADTEPRLRMLETIRTYAAEVLEASGEAELLHARHTAYFVELAEQSASRLVGPDRRLWLGRLERERGNLRAVERWAIARGDLDALARLTAGLAAFWLARGEPADARERLRVVPELLRTASHSGTLARAFECLAQLAEKVGDYTTGRSLMEEALRIARDVGEPQALASVLDSLGRLSFIQARDADARRLLEESFALFSQMEDRNGLARVMSHLGFLNFHAGNVRAARVVFDQGLAIASELRDQHRVAEFLDNLGNTAEAEGDLEGAAAKFQQAVAAWRDLEEGHWLAMSLNNLGRVLTVRGELRAARAHLHESLTIARRLGNRRRLAFTLQAVARLLAAEGELERAVRLHASASATLSQIGARIALPVRDVYALPLDVQLEVAPPALEEAVDDALGWLTASDSRAPGPGASALTPREYQVAVLIADGLSNREIAEALVISERTVTSHVEHIFNRLGFRARSQIASWATQRRLT